MENDSETLVVLVREMCLIYAFYCVLMGIFLILSYRNPVWSVYFVGSVLFVLVLFRSFHHEIRSSFWPLIFLLLIGAVLPALLLGWNLGFQNLLYSILLLLLFNPRLELRTKRLTGVIAFAILSVLALFTNLYNGTVISAENPSFATTLLYLNEIVFLGCICVVGLTFSGISQEAEHRLFLYNEKLKAVAGTDPLTGLMNRRSTKTRLQEIAENYKRDNVVVTVAIGDIDFFKNVNDTYGHDAGDFVLTEVGALLQDYMKERGFAARWGGEEFLFIFSGFNGDEATLSLDKLRTEIASKEFIYKDQSIPICMTFGVAEYDASPSFDETINEADGKLYIGKQSGRNQVVF